MALAGLHCFLLHFPESNVRQWKPNRPGPHRPSGEWGFRVSKGGFGWVYYFLLHVPESNVRHWQPNRPGPLRPSGAFGVGGKGWQPLSGQRPPGRGIAVRQFSPLRRREGPRPLPATPPAAKKCRVLRCFVLFPFFPIFRILWFKMGQHGPR